MVVVAVPFVEFLLPEVLEDDEASMSTVLPVIVLLIVIKSWFSLQIKKQLSLSFT